MGSFPSTAHPLRVYKTPVGEGKGNQICQHFFLQLESYLNPGTRLRERQESRISHPLQPHQVERGSSAFPRQAGVSAACPQLPGQVDFTSSLPCPAWHKRHFSGPVTVSRRAFCFVLFEILLAVFGSSFGSAWLFPSPPRESEPAPGCPARRNASVPSAPTSPPHQRRRAAPSKEAAARGTYGSSTGGSAIRSARRRFLAGVRWKPPPRRDSGRPPAPRSAGRLSPFALPARPSWRRSGAAARRGAPHGLREPTSPQGDRQRRCRGPRPAQPAARLCARPFSQPGSTATRVLGGP